MLVLVAHSDRWTRLLVSQVVSEAGCEVVEASNGMAAVRVAQRERPDLVLLGPELSEIDTQDVVGVLREQPRTRALPIVMLAESTPVRQARVWCPRPRGARRRRTVTRIARRHVQASAALLPSV